MTKIDIASQVQILMNQFNAKNFDVVISKTKQLIRQKPGFVILYNLLGSSFQNKGDFLNAESTFKLGLKYDPSNIALMNNLATSYKNLLKYKSAEELFNKILKQNDKYINAYINLGNLKRDLNKFEDAIKLYKKAELINRNNPIIYFSLALAYQGIGKFEKANENAKKALNLDPNLTQADHLISQSTKYDKDNEHYQDLIQKIDNKSLKEYQIIDLCFSLAKAEEDIGNIKLASDYLIRGNKLKKELLKYSVKNEILLLNDIRERFKHINFEEFKNNNQDKIIFILGMPRSGTSLVEQIITSHSKVFGAGELPILSNIVKKNFILENSFKNDLFNEIIENASKIEHLRLDYKNFIKNFNYKEEFITDKAPLNFRWIGFIRILFPNAKIIHCIRDPKDNYLSMFKNLFEGGLNFTYDQDDILQYYKNYHQLMIFWKSLLGDFIYDIKYEDLIKDKNSEIRKIINFCGLNWEEKCLMFHENNTPIKTMSTAQARKPIYKTSLNSFDKFKKFLIKLDNDT